jgi:hypothetical protein
MERPGDTADLLHFLIQRMDDEIESGEARVEPPLLLRLDGADVACATDGIDLHVKRLDGHPAEVLTGFVAPPEWFGVGVLTGGWGHEPGKERYRVRVTSFMCRDGAELAAMRADGSGELRFLEGRSDGLVADTLRRVLELPTNPPDVSVEEWFARCWLDAIVAGTKRGKRAAKLGWQEAAELHPALASMGAASDFSWERVRQRVAAEGSEMAAWMDEGMFARSTVYGRPSVDLLLSRAERRLTPDARRRVHALLREWGLLDRSSVA